MKKALPLYLILLLAIILRLKSLDQSFWLDEAVQAVISGKNLVTVNWGADFQPPLFYLLSHLWLKIGPTAEWFLRLPSVVFGVLTVYLLYIFCKQFFNEKAALLASLLLATAPFHIYYSQEFRMYAFFTFLALLSWILLTRAKWRSFTLVTLLSLFTHYFAFVNIIAQIAYILFFDRKSVQVFFVRLGLAMAPFILWLPILAQQIKTAGNLVTIWPRWQEVSSVSFLKFPGLVLAKFTVGMISPENRLVYAGIVVITGAIFLLSLAKARKLKGAVPLVTFLVVPLVVTWIAGLWLAANSPWRIQFVLPALYAIIAAGLTNPGGSTPGVRKLILIYLLAQNIAFSTLYLTQPRYHREDWRGAIAYSDQKAGDGALVLSEFNMPLAPMEWYSKKYHRYFGASTSQAITELSVAEKLDPLITTSNHIVLYTYLFEISDPNRHVETYLQQQNFRLITEKDFHGVGIIKEFVR